MNDEYVVQSVFFLIKGGWKLTRIYLTKEGYHKLKEELQHLELIEQPKNQKRIKHARSFCDFNEDSEYEAALQEQMKIKERINELKRILQEAEIKKELEDPPSTVRVGSIIEVLDIEMGERERFMLVEKEEADMSENKVSIDSPFGKALLGAREKEEIAVHSPQGIWFVKIEQIIS